MSENAYPLQWPDGWPRTPEEDRKFGRFGTKKTRGGSNWASLHDITIAEALRRINSELEALDGPGRNWNRIDMIVISTNLKIRKGDGQPHSSQSAPDDPGAAVYFELDGKRQCVPCDSYTKVAQNLAGIAATISAIRTLERHGSGLMQRAFTGFEALPHQSSGAWWAVLGVSPTANPDEVKDAYKAKRRATHPDREGGSHEAFVQVTEAWNQYIANA